MLSITKLVVLVLAVLGAWYLFRFAERANEARAARFGSGGAKAENNPKATKAGKREIEDLVKCQQCGSYVSANAHSCGREDCPYPR